jgi:hypothetical protein
LAYSLLADKTSPPPGSRLWSKQGLGPAEINKMTERLPSVKLGQVQTQDSPLSDTPSHHPSASAPIQAEPSHRRKIEILLDQLAKIEQNVESLSVDTTAGLEGLKHTLREVPAAFQLKGLYLTCKKLLDDLDTVSGKAHSVVELKAQIKSQLYLIHNLLKKAKLDWSARWSSAPMPDVFDQGVEHNTGQCITPQLRLPNYLLPPDHHF